MSKPLIDRSKYDHPEHFEDRIREYRTLERYVPTPLMHLLYEMAGHRCTLCGAPWLEIHHIDPLGNGGETTYDNLIVLCPNCHTRVHSENIPSSQELRHYKLKQEIAYGLPILTKISSKEKELLLEMSTILQEQANRSIVISAHLKLGSWEERSDEAIRDAMEQAGYHYLESEGIILALSREPYLLPTAELQEGYNGKWGVELEIRLTSKGYKWLKYLIESDKLKLLT